MPRAGGAGLAWLAALLSCVAGRPAGAGGEQLESMRKKCMRTKAYAPVRKAGDLNATFEPILNGEAWQEFGPKVLSTDPWVVYFDKLLSEEEVQALEANMFSESQDFHKSSAGGGGGRHLARYSETAFCLPGGGGGCDDDISVQNLRARASKITHVPPENFDLSQALRYKEGMYYRQHHDNHPTFHYLPCGSRIYTYFVYLSDEGLEGGATFFPMLNIRAPAKRGAAVLFVNTKDNNPMRTDDRTTHESEIVTKGEKRGINMWLYQYNFRDFWQRACTSIELADELGRAGKPAVPVAPTVTFSNHAAKPFYIFEAPDREQKRYIGEVLPDNNLSVPSADGNVLQIFNKKSGGKLVSERAVLAKSTQIVNIGKKKPKDEL